MIINSMHIMSLLSVVKSQSIQVGTSATQIPNNPLTAGQSISFNIPENVNIYGKSESGTIKVEILEFS